MPKKLACVGGGAKAAAIAAKAAALRACGFNAPEVTIFEPNGIGANWRAGGGYTDGEQRLCSLSEHDLGFPYAISFSGAANEHMLGRYSWQAFLADTTTPPISGYAGWMARGRRPARHREFADYLSWAVTRSGFSVIPGKVVALHRLVDSAGDTTWDVECNNAGSRRFRGTGFDGVVVSGPGAANSSLFSTPDPRQLTSVNFWSGGYGAWISTSVDPDSSIVIIGAGGTAAAIVERILAEPGRRHPVRCVGNKPTLLERSNGFLERLLVTDVEKWRALSIPDRQTMLDRTTRGIVWEQVLERISAFDDFDFSSGSVRRISQRTGYGAQSDLVVETDTGAQIDAALIIDATGFRGDWYMDLLGQSERAWIQALPSPAEQYIDVELTFGSASDVPGLHLPALGGLNHGPAVSNLLGLGTMSDMVLSRYVP